MLRIHTEASPDGITLRLEGKLAQPWVDEVAKVWTAFAAQDQDKRRIQVDMEHVSFVDKHGESLLCLLLQAGCQLHGSGAYIRGVIEELPAPKSPPPNPDPSI
jgi:ABC-type transporter Mla MlaB component